MVVGQQELQLKVLWLKNVLGLAIDQKVTKHRYPVTQYYFWPRTEAWDQLKLELDSRVGCQKKIKSSYFKSCNRCNYALAGE